MSELQRNGLLFLWLPVMRLSQIALPIVCARIAAVNFAWPVAAMLGIVLALALAGSGALLLLRSKVGEVTWRNHLAGWCLPCGTALGHGRLLWIVLSCSLVWTLAYWCVLIIEVTSGFQSAIHWMLLASWFVLGWGMQWLLGTLMKNYELTSRSGWNLLKIIALLSVVLIVSLTLQISARSWYALVVAAAPLIIAGVPYGVFILSVLTFGRNARWN